MIDTPLTMCLCNFARTEQTHEIIDELCRQTVRPKIFVWNNNPDIHFQNAQADLVINSSKNVHVRHTPALWQLAKTPYVARMDDDLHFADNTLIADAVAAMGELNAVTQMIGAYGVRIYRNCTYAESQHIAIPKGHGQYAYEDGPVRAEPNNLQVDLLKGRFLMLTSRAATKLLCNCPHYHADLYFGTTLAGQQRMHHTAHGCFFDRDTCEGRLVDFPVDGQGYCDMEGHGNMRDQLCEAWVSRCLLHPKVKDKPPKKQPDPDVPGQAGRDPR